MFNKERNVKRVQIYVLMYFHENLGIIYINCKPLSHFMFYQLKAELSFSFIMYMYINALKCVLTWIYCFVNNVAEI